jgi:hypothetical protein
MGMVLHKTDDPEGGCLSPMLAGAVKGDVFAELGG